MRRRCLTRRERDRLAAVPLGEFVRARNALAKQLREAGRPAEAAEVVRLPKPSAPVWVVNQLARRDAPAVERLVLAPAAGLCYGFPRHGACAGKSTRDPEGTPMSHLANALVGILAR